MTQGQRVPQGQSGRQDRKEQLVQQDLRGTREPRFAHGAGESGGLLRVIGAACTDAFSITMKVPADGTEVVTGVTRLRIHHTTRTEDRWFIAVDVASVNCLTGAGTWPDSIQPDIASDANVWVSAMARRSFAVTAGTSNFYLSGSMVSGKSAGDVFIYAGLTAVFYLS